MTDRPDPHAPDAVALGQAIARIERVLAAHNWWQVRDDLRFKRQVVRDRDLRLLLDAFHRDQAKAPQ